MNKWMIVSYSIFLMSQVISLNAEELMTQAMQLCNEQITEQDIDIKEKAYHYFNEMHPIIKIRIGAFLPSSERFRKIYGSCIPTYQLELQGTFLKCYQAWLNVDLSYKKGHSDHLDYFTTMQTWTLSSGVSIPHQLSEDFTAYGGIGGAIGWIKIHNRSTTRYRNEKKLAPGLMLKLGIMYTINCHYFVDFFLDYLYMPTSFKTHIDAGGLKTGIGVGLKF